MPDEENRIVIDTADGNDAYGLIVSDLVSLIAQVQASLSRIESAIAAADEQVPDADVVLLDDVTPRYARAGALLKACDAGLGAALKLMLDSKVRRRLN